LATTTSATVQHRLGLKVEIRSEAPFLRLGKHKWGKREDFVDTEGYALRFKFKNLQSVPFPSGCAFMRVIWTSGQFVTWRVDIPQLKPEQEDYAKFDRVLTEQKSEALSSGFGLFFCRGIDPTNTGLTSFDGATSYEIGPDGQSIQSVKVTTWNTIYAKYSMYISAVALIIIALEGFIPFLSWAFSVLARFLCSCVRVWLS
jgi:hypothetical protein